MLLSEEPRRILVVDDDPAWCLLVADELRDAGHDPIPVASPEEALDALRTTPVALLVLDVLFGARTELLGIELAAGLSQHEQWRNIPIVFLTVLGTEEVRRHLTERGVDTDEAHVRVVSKPFDFRAFGRTVNELLAKAPQQG